MSCCPWAEPDPFPFAFHVDVALVTDPGRERPRNEDRAAVGCASSGARFVPPALASLDSRGLYAVVCDGMGGEAGGEIASQIATESIVAFLGARWPWRSVDAALVESVVDAGERIQRAARAACA